MGKRNFKNLYQRIQREHGIVTCEISKFSDTFNPLYRYAGVIVYAIDGQFQWDNQENGNREKSFYIIIQCTDKWPDEYYKPVGQGTVHDYLLKRVIGIESDQKRIACGGFAYLFGQLRFSSIWLNGTDQIDGESDGDRYLSEPEEVLVKYCWDEYKRHGPHHIFSIPYFIEKLLFN